MKMNKWKILENIRVMLLVSIQTSQFSHNVYSTNYFFSNTFDGTVYIGFTKDINFLKYLRFLIA